VTRIIHTSDLHFGRPSVSEQLDSMAESVRELEPDAIAVSGDLTQRCSNAEFEQAREYLDRMRQTAPVLVIPGNHDIRWLGAVARNLGLFGRQAHEFKYSRYFRHISEDLSPTLEVPGAVIAGVNTAHGISRGSLTRRFRDLGVIGHVKRRDIEKVERAFESAAPGATRIVMIHHEGGAALLLAARRGSHTLRPRPPGGDPHRRGDRAGSRNLHRRNHLQPRPGRQTIELQPRRDRRLGTQYHHLLLGKLGLPALQDARVPESERTGARRGLGQDRTPRGRLI
jgi:hypothetical protein